MTTGALLPAAAATTTSSFKPAASRHGRLPSQHDGVPSPSRLALWLVHLVRRSTVVQLVLALTACGSLLRLAVIHRADGAWNGTAEPGLSTLGGVLDIGGGDGSDLSKGRHPHQPQKAAAAAAGKDPIGIEVGWDFDGVYRVLTGGAEASTGSLSPLGPKADNSFQLLAPGDPDAYWQTLETFAQTAFPPTLAAQLLASLEAYRSEPDSPAAAAAAAPGPGMRDFPHIWQTAKVDQARDDGYWTEKNAGWDWSLLDDAEAAAWARAALSGEVEGDGAGVGDGAGATSAMREVWEKMGLSGKGGILRSDMLRYLLLLVSGGVYTDTDTVCLKPISQWGQDPRVLLPNSPQSRGEPKVIIGIEADVGTREDWNDWWPRPLQFVQWTISSAPHHPIFIDVLRRISLSTSRATDWLRARDALADRLRAAGNDAEAERVGRLDVFEVKGVEGASEKELGLGVSVMEWTGPGVWTDSVVSYLKAGYGLSWPVFKDLRRPFRVGEVTVLPVTGFSPGVGLFGAQATWDAEAMVEHKFKGTWKDI